MKRILSILIIMFAGILVLAGCGKKEGLTENPNKLSTVISNGGMIVQKEDYAYFINGYVSAKDLTNPKTDNTFGEVTIGAVYRVKLVNGEVPTNDDGDVTGADMVVSKVVGFENGGFYIFGDYIYYATPNMASDSSGTLLNDTVNFCRINISGAKGTNETLSKGVKVGDTGDWKAYYIDGSVYFVVYAESKLTSIKIGEKKNEMVTMASDVTGASLPEYEIFSPVNRESAPEYEGKEQLDSYNQWIYYTKNQAEESSKRGNILLKVKIGTEDSVTVEETDTAYAVVSQKDGYLFYTKTNGAVDESPAILYKSSLVYNLGTETRISNAEYENVFILQQGTTTAVIIYTDSLLKVSLNNGTSYQGLVNDTITVIRANGNYIYYYNNTDKTLNRVNVFNGAITVLYSEDDDNSLKLSGTLNADVVGNKILFYIENEDVIKTLIIDCAGNGVKVLKIYL